MSWPHGMPLATNRLATKETLRPPQTVPRRLSARGQCSPLIARTCRDPRSSRCADAAFALQLRQEEGRGRHDDGDEREGQGGGAHPSGVLVSACDEADNEGWHGR